MKRLIAFGDSFTFGYELHEEADSATVPHLQAWPNQLAVPFKLDPAQVVNISVPGISNKAIWYNVTHFDFQPGDSVFICWSYPERYTSLSNYVDTSLGTDIFLRRHDEYLINVRTTDITNRTDKSMTNFYKYFSDIDALHSTMLYMDHAHTVVSKAGAQLYHLGVPFVEFYKQLSGNHYNDDITLIPSWFNISMLATMDPERLAKNKVCESGHLNVSGHIAFAKRIYTLLTNP